FPDGGGAPLAGPRVRVLCLGRRRSKQHTGRQHPCHGRQAEKTRGHDGQPHENRDRASLTAATPAPPCLKKRLTNSSLFTILPPTRDPARRKCFMDPTTALLGFSLA